MGYVERILDCYSLAHRGLGLVNMQNLMEFSIAGANKNRTKQSIGKV